MGEYFISSNKISIFLLVSTLIALINHSYSSNEDRKVYIVYMGAHSGAPQTKSQSLSSIHFSMLQRVVDIRFLNQSLVRSYTRSFNGFAARLTPQQHNLLAGHEDVVSIFPSVTYHLQTTRSWDFTGLPENVGRSPTVESDTIVGLIDSGVWPESSSFSDDGFGPPPAKWKGACNGGEKFTCNNKLIGARYYPEGSDTARDMDGHGSHTASTVAGYRVPNASFYGIAAGTATGGVPAARVAAYKACYEEGCWSEYILAAFDDAIADGVDLISISIGGPAAPVEADVVALGSLHASQRGVLVVQAGGNDGEKWSVGSVAPWILSAAAGSTDRGIVTRVVLGDGREFTGKAVSSFRLGRDTGVVLPAKNRSSGCDEISAWRCDLECLDPSLVKGKILLCDDPSGVIKAFMAGAAGVVATLGNYQDYSDVTPLAASRLTEHDFQQVRTYFESAKSPTLEILKSESIRNIDAPKVAGFSSKGPNRVLPDILKPDITGPGIEILAAYSPMNSPARIPMDMRSVNYSILSGTSMACPHVAAAAAYVKTFHPNWSHSAIKSALMTTARAMDASKHPLAEFSYGVGHIDPVKAIDPGLVYETSTEDYITMFCGLGYDPETIRMIFGGNSTCPAGGGAVIKPKDLNYPSLTSQVETQNFETTFRRTVRNVGSGGGRYTVKTSSSPRCNITVQPSILSFETEGQRRSFDVMISGVMGEGGMVSASVEWSDGVRKVRSPVVVYL